MEPQEYGYSKSADSSLSPLDAARSKPDPFAPQPTGMPQSPLRQGQVNQAGIGAGNPMGYQSSLIPSMADDTDLIENEWVSAVKKVIEGHRGDPFGQSQAMTSLRADYMKKRYNKTIKTSEK